MLLLTNQSIQTTHGAGSASSLVRQWWVIQRSNSQGNKKGSRTNKAPASDESPSAIAEGAASSGSGHTTLAIDPPNLPKARTAPEEASTAPTEGSSESTARAANHREFRVQGPDRRYQSHWQRLLQVFHGDHDRSYEHLRTILPPSQSRSRPRSSSIQRLHS